MLKNVKKYTPIIIKSKNKAGLFFYHSQNEKELFVIRNSIKKKSVSSRVYNHIVDKKQILSTKALKPSKINVYSKPIKKGTALLITEKDKSIVGFYVGTGWSYHSENPSIIVQEVLGDNESLLVCDVHAHIYSLR